MTENTRLKATELSAKFPGLKVVVCGSWIWVTGEAKAVAKELSASGLHYNRQKAAWYYKPDGKKGYRTKKTMDWGYIVSNYGLTEVSA